MSHVPKILIVDDETHMCHSLIGNALNQKRLEKENRVINGRLELSEERYRYLVQSSPDMIYTLDHEGNFTFVNDKLKSMLGYKGEQLIGKHHSVIIFEKDLEKAKYFVKERRTGDRGAVGVVLRLKQNQHTNNPAFFQVKRLTVELNAVGMYDNSGTGQDKQFIGTYGVARDISDRKRLEAQLLQAKKIEAVGTLVAGIAHNFNNLLMGIQGYASLMLLDIDSSHPHYNRLMGIKNQVQSGARLTSHLLGYARKGRYEIKPISLNKLVEETSDTFGRTRKEITIHRELAEGLFAIEADCGQIEQVLLNLYVNAADAMSTCANGAAGRPGGGNLILKTKNTTHDNMKGEVYDLKPGNYVMLTVTDTGVGMDKKTMECIFDPFFTTKEMGRRTGLGLASAYGIIKAHGGYIDVESKKGHGTTFSIYFPASEKKVRKAVKAAEEFIKGTGTVLLVDDEEVILEVGTELLEAAGYRALTARDGKEAIEVYRKNRHDIDIVLLDMVMPNMGGGETYDTLKEANPNVKVLLSSGYSIDGQARQILARGCEGFIQKPFTMGQLSQSIRKILYRKEVQPEI